MLDDLGAYVWYAPRPEKPWAERLKLDVREGSKDPPSEKPGRVIYTHTVPPAWEMPDFDAVPWDDIGEECVRFYETPTYVYTVAVPPMRMVMINNISYQWSIDMAVGDVFVVEILRNHDTLATWEDRVISVAGDLGARFALASHSRPAPCYARFDRNDVIGVRVTFRGPFPFGVAKNVPVPGPPHFRVLLNGWSSPIAINTDGQSKAPRTLNVEEQSPALTRAMELVKLRRGAF
jgi:hypothetical protein